MADGIVFDESSGEEEASRETAVAFRGKYINPS